MASAARATENPIAHQNQQPPQPQQQTLKCPRCNSSNTKFCYYNNYSLSQPRHFCKACKRYWTRGGTLRNVPVGGGCRKNKRIKRTFTRDTATHGAATSVTVGHNPNPNLDHSTPSNNNLNPLYGLLQVNPKYPRFDPMISDASDTETDVSRYHLFHPHTSSLELVFSSSDPGATVMASHAHNSISLVSSYPSIFIGGSSTSSLHQQPTFLGFERYGDGAVSVVNDVQMEGTKSRTGWNNNFNGQNHNGQIKSVESSDPTSFLWTTIGVDGGEWLDPTSNICSSVPSLI